MELLEDNHRVELRVYQQKVKHLEYEHRNNIKGIVQDGTTLLESEQQNHETKDRELLRMKEQLKFEQMELELVNISKVAEIRQQSEKQLIKLRQQFDDGIIIILIIILIYLSSFIIYVRYDRTYFTL